MNDMMNNEETENEDMPRLAEAMEKMKKQSDILDIFFTITADDIINLLQEKHGKLPTENSVKDLDILVSNCSSLLFHLEMKRNNDSFKLHNSQRRIAEQKGEK